MKLTGTKLDNKGEVTYKLDIPQGVKDAFTYSLVVFEGYADQPSFVSIQTVSLVSVDSIKIFGDLFTDTKACDYLTHDYVQVYSAKGATNLPVEFNSLRVMKSVNGNTNVVVHVKHEHQGRAFVSFNMTAGKHYLEVDIGNNTIRQDIKSECQKM